MSSKTSPIFLYTKRMENGEPEDRETFVNINTVKSIRFSTDEDEKYVFLETDHGLFRTKADSVDNLLAYDKFETH